MLSIDGLITGLDTDSIVQGLLSVQKTQIDRENIRRQQIEVEQEAFGTLRSNLGALQSQIFRLGRANGEIFESRVATASDEDAIGVAASDDAVTGVYSLRINKLARAHQLASQGFASENAEIGEGSLTFQVGDREAVSVTIDDTNNTLQGLVDQINSTSRDVSAAIINTGSDDGSPFKILLTSRHTGSANDIQVTGTLSGAPANSPTFDVTVQEATDAEIQFGAENPDNPGGSTPIIAVSSTSKLEDVIPGVTLDLRQADVDKEITVTVEPDGEAIRSAMSDFVGAFNTVMTFINDNSKYDQESDTAGLFLGDRNAVSIQSELRDTAGALVRGLRTGANRLSAAGISFGSNGLLEFNPSDLDDVIDGTNQQVSLDDIRRLFVLDGQLDRPGIEFLSGSHHTQASEYVDGSTTELEAIGVDIALAAKQAELVAGTSLASSIVVDDTNNQLAITIDGLELSLTLGNGTYTQTELADHIATAVNGHSDIGGRELVAAIDGDKLQLSSISYGSLSEIAIGTADTNSAHTILGFAGTEQANGRDVVGKFLLPNGETETATGQGRILSGDDDNEFTRDLRLRISLTDDDLVAGKDADLTITRGVAGLLDLTLRSMLDGEFSDFNLIEDAFERRLESIDESVARLNERFEAREQSILAEFAALEAAVAELQSTGQALGSSLASLPLATA